MSDELAAPAPAPATETTPKPSIVERISIAIDTALSSPPKLTGWAKTDRTILDLVGGPSRVCDKDELAKLVAYDKQWDAAYLITCTDPHEHAKRAHGEHTAKLGAAIQDGTIAGTAARTFESFATEYEAKQDAAKAEMVRIHQEGGKKCMEIGARFCRAADKFIAASEANEKSLHDQFGVPYRPSALIVALREARKIAWLRSEPIEKGNLPPKMMLPWLLT